MLPGLNRIITYTAAVVLTGMVSCDLNKINYTSDDASDVQNESVSSAYFEDVSDLSGTVIAAPTETAGGRRKLLISDNRFLCADINLDLDAASTLKNPLGSVSVDFGSGCADNHGNTRNGRIILTFTGKRFVAGSTSTVAFDGYAINGVTIAGTFTLTYAATSSEQHPQFTISVVGGKLTWPDGTFATRESEYAREWIRSADGITDEWHVTGSATGVNRKGRQYLVNVTKELIYLQICKEKNAKFLPSKGKEEFVAGKKILVDFGDGSCDQEVTIDIKSKSTQVNLSKNN